MIRRSNKIPRRPARLVFFVALFGIIGVVTLLVVRAATPTAALEPEQGTVVTATVGSSAAASGGQYVKFGPAAPSGTVKIMPLGDSITQGGNGVDATLNGYRLALLNNLSSLTINYVGPNSSGNAQLADKDHAGYAGQCIKVNPCNGYPQSLYQQTAGWLNTYQPDIAIIEGGTNDWGQGGVDTDAELDQSMRDWIALIYATRPTIRVIVIGATGWHPGYDTLIQTHVAQQKAAGKKIEYVPFANVSTFDGTHPDAAGYITLANALAPKVQSLLAQ